MTLINLDIIKAIKSSTYFSKALLNHYKINKNFMHRTVSEGINLALIRRNIVHSVLKSNQGERNMSYISTKQFKGPAKVFANDGSGKHPHVIESSCEKEECSTKVCVKPCTDENVSKIKGHFTHKPPIGRNCKFLSEKDCSNKNDSQYFIRAIPVKKPIISVQMKDFEEKKYAINHESGTNFCHNNEELIRKITK